MRVKLGLSLLIVAVLTGCGGGLDLSGGSNTDPAAAVLVAEDGVQPAGNLVSVGQSPATIRARYGFVSLTTDAQQGSGQIIVIISAYDNPTAAADLAAFSAQHGLPPCPAVATTYTASAAGTQAVVPRPAPGDGCTFQKFNASTNGTSVSTAAYPYDTTGKWITESNMDIQWAHAIAPKAKIVLVQGANNLFSSLTGAIKYSNKFADVTSMSWGSLESSLVQKCTTTELTTGCTPFNKTQTYLTSLDAAFSSTNTVYIAASGDTSTRVQWPATSPKVLAVGGTNNLTAVDTAWAGSTGGISPYYAVPAWQSGVNGSAQRTVPDVALVADPSSPVSVYITPQPAKPDTTCVAANGAANCGWYGAYGTSVSAPMWAGLAAITRAVRIESGRSAAPANQNFAASLYNVAAVQGTYVITFGDVTTGTNGYAAKTGYDMVTGLGVPRADVLLGYLTNQ